MMPELKHLNVGNALLAGEQIRTQRSRNALADLEYRGSLRADSVLADPSSTPRDYARVGRSDVANALTNIDNAEAARAKQGDETRMKAIGQLGTIAQRAIGSPDSRGFVRQMATNPAYARVFRDAGLDPAQIDFNSPTFDTDLRTWASLAPEPQMETFEGPDGSILQREPGTNKMKAVLGRAPRPLVNVALPEQKYEDAATKAAGEAAGKAFADVKDRGRLATEELDSLRALRASDASTGPGAEAIAFTTQVARQLGIPVSDKALERAAAIGQYGAAANNLVLNRQLAQKGPQTESDAKRIRDTLAKSSNVAEVNRAILDYNIAIKEREMEAADFAENYRLEAGKVDGWEKAWRQYLRDTPIATNHSKTGALIFYHQFRDKIQEADPTMSEEQVRQEWRRVSRER